MAAMQAMMRGMRAELQLRFDGPAASRGGEENVCGDSLCASDSSETVAEEVTLSVSLRCDIALLLVRLDVFAVTKIIRAVQAADG